MSIELNRIIHSDCLDIMKDIPDKYFELAIVDPPYGIGISKAKEIGYKGFNTFTSKDWDNSTPTQEYFKEIFRVSKNQIIWGGNYFPLPTTRCFVVWDKGEGFYGRTYAECELAWTSFDANAKIFKRDPLAQGDYKGKVHPTQKPVALYKWLLKNYAKEGDKILDTHAGSCSSVIACIDYGFQYLAIEKDKEYFDKATERIEKHLLQYKLLA